MEVTMSTITAGVGSRRWLLVLALAVTAGCGGSSGGPPAPTVTGVAPGSGTALGGTPVTVTGSGFSSGVVSVAFGANAATGLSVVNDTQLTCVTPPGAPGATVAVAVFGPGGAGTLAAAFTYHPAPSVGAVVPGSGSTSGGLDVTITGTGFVANAAGTNLVTFDGVAATNVLTVDDLKITCTTPAGTEGFADVGVTNANGPGVLAAGFEYLLPRLYAADGRNNIAGNLYLVDPTNGNTTIVGPIGFAITGMAFAPDGTLYGVTPANAATQQLVTIDVQTGAGTLVAPLLDAGAVQQGCTDITFVGSRLLGWGQPTKTLNQRALEINPVTGLVTDLGGGTVSGGGNAFEADGAGTLRLIRTSGSTRTIFDVDPVTGVSTLDMNVTPDGFGFNSMAFLEGVLYAVETANGVPPTTLTSIDVVSGAATSIGPLPLNVDGIAGDMK
jgi:hypothetical protein